MDAQHPADAQCQLLRDSRLAYYFSLARHSPKPVCVMVRTTSSLEWMAESRPRLSDVDQKCLTESRPYCISLGHLAIGARNVLRIGTKDLEAPGISSYRTRRVHHTNGYSDSDRFNKR